MRWNRRDTEGWEKKEKSERDIGDRGRGRKGIGGPEGHGCNLERGVV